MKIISVKNVRINSGIIGTVRFKPQARKIIRCTTKGYVHMPIRVRESAFGYEAFIKTSRGEIQTVLANTPSKAFAKAVSRFWI